VTVQTMLRPVWVSATLFASSVMVGSANAAPGGG
jgi:hypothetical protein